VTELLAAARLEQIARNALSEDLNAGDITSDITSNALIAERASCEGTILLKQPAVVCGLVAAEAVFHAARRDHQLQQPYE
jgi:nicotinate-nucleotide pyrophosphorylase